MYEKKICQIMKALGLSRQILGIKFLVYKKEYADTPALDKANNSIISMISAASHGERIKANAYTLKDPEDCYSIGIKKIPDEVISGRHEYSTGNYESLSIARKVYESYHFIPQKIYGIEISPLSEMTSSDLVIFIGSAKDMMRIMQAYTLHYGVAKNLLSTGNGSLCADLITRPFILNDINLTLFNTNIRKSKIFDCDEMGMAVPIHMIPSILDGILNTVNLTENNKPKKEILQRLDFPEELGFSIKMNYDYAIQAMEYQKHCERCLQEETIHSGE